MVRVAQLILVLLSSVAVSRLTAGCKAIDTITLCLKKRLP
jgi:hypothetical protein